jgi:hypothetical protein
MPAVWINSPLTGDHVSPTFPVNVGWNLARLEKGPRPVVGGEKIRLTVAGALGIGPTNPYPLPDTSGSVTFMVSYPLPAQPTEIEVVADLLDSADKVLASDSETVTVLVGGIIIAPPPPPPPPGLRDDADGDSVTAQVADAAGGVVAGVTGAVAGAKPCPPPVVLNGTFPTNPANPTIGMVAEIYRVEDGEKVVDFLAIPHLLGSAVVAYPDGSARVGSTFAVVFPPAARKKNRQYRLSLLGVLGRILITQSGPVV